ncbi:hypothetical protein [Cupriavidus sp. YAF13]|uniref:hypothetical protein n=1 Tax=Cupriavidus sp. YAF13 TaxID=3233075 RepID=UPI003F8F478D
MFCSEESLAMRTALDERGITATDDKPTGNGPYLRRMGWVICKGFCWLAERLSYATAAMLLTDLIVWEKDGYIVRKYLNIDALPGSDEQAR